MRSAASIQLELDTPPLSRGQLLADGRFVVQRELGRGGMGIVYEALDRAHQRRVALKIARCGGPRHVARLHEEFCATSTLQHPNLVQAHGLHHDHELCFLSMQLVEGVTLRRHAPTRLTGLRQLFGQLALGVHALHQFGRVHRDLKPANVMVTPAGRVVVIDFGLSSERSSARHAAFLDAGCGTPRYRAPEQNAARTPEAAADWYAVGVMLSEFLAQCRVRPTRADEGVLARLQTLCLGLLETCPTKRPTGAQIVQALHARADCPLPRRSVRCHGQPTARAALA